MSEKIWYYAVGGVRQGPVALDELRALAVSGAFGPDDLVWQPAFGSEWRAAGGVPELFGTVPPPVPPDAGRSTLDAQRATFNDESASGVPLAGVTGARPSCLAAVTQAFERTVAVLFRPFDVARWFSIGFCAWLAYIGTQSSVNPNQTGAVSSEVFKQRFDRALDALFASPPGPTELAAGGGILAVGLLLALLFCRLRSRGDFMFLHRWYKPDAPISQCWWASRAAGRELFVWRVYFFLISALLFALLAAAVYATVLQPYMAAGKTWSDALARPAIGCATAAVLLSLTVQGVAHLAKAFVVPVMYWHGVTASRAWLAVFSLCNQYPFAVLGYLACGIGCAVAAGLAILAFGLLTCCIGFVPLFLPYVGSVALLPVTFFFRGYAVCFLSRWRPDLVPDQVTGNK
jgi:hypothetical protein